MDQAILELFGDYGQLVLAIIGCFAALAALLPAPAEDGNKIYRAFYKVVNWLAMNVGNAANATDVKTSANTTEKDQ